MTRVLNLLDPESTLMTSKKAAILLVAVLSLGTALLLMTSPDSVPTGVLTVPILLIFAATYLASLLIIRAVKLYANNPRGQNALALGIGLWGALALVFQSTGGLVAGDLILMFAITILAYIYVTRF